MGDITGFKKYKRINPPVQEPEDRIQHFQEFIKETKDDFKTIQAARCMDCGVPFCHAACPLDNHIPAFNDAVFQKDWQKAYSILNQTNNFPEFTGRICPAPCEASCVLGINNDAVAIEFIEKSIIETAFQSGWVNEEAPSSKKEQKIAIVGSGPSGLAAADQLIDSGYSVTIYEKSNQPGGLLRYGIPDYKLEKNVVERRMEVMKKKGVQFICGTEIGKDIKIKDLQLTFDAVLLCGGAEKARDLPIPGRTLKGVHFAMEFLKWNNQRISQEHQEQFFDIKDKNILVIGGGDTGSDCIGTSHRLGAKSVTQIELLAKPPHQRTEDNPWPLWPMTLKTSSSHEEGGQREWSILTKRFLTHDGTKLDAVETVRVEWNYNQIGELEMQEIKGTTRIIPCDYAFLAIGFLHPIHKGLINNNKLLTNSHGHLWSNQYMTNVDGIFTAGDMRMGQSLVVHAIAEGRKAAEAITHYLSSETREQHLPSAYSQLHI